MKVFNRNLKLFLSLIGITSNVTAQTNNNSAALSGADQIEINETNYTTQKYQFVSQEELLNAIQNNKLEQLLFKKGILIQKPSADSTICKSTGTTVGD